VQVEDREAAGAAGLGEGQAAAVGQADGPRYGGEAGQEGLLSAPTKCLQMGTVEARERGSVTGS
jgi:hypothetical protein